MDDSKVFIHYFCKIIRLQKSVCFNNKPIGYMKTKENPHRDNLRMSKVKEIVE